MVLLVILEAFDHTEEFLEVKHALTGLIEALYRRGNLVELRSLEPECDNLNEVLDKHVCLNSLALAIFSVDEPQHVVVEVLHNVSQLKLFLYFNLDLQDVLNPFSYQ